MKLMELIYQGVGNSDELKKIVFSQDYNRIETSQSGISKEMFEEIFAASLFPAYQPSLDILRIQPRENSKLRVGITFSHQGVAYRFVRDLSKKACSLSKYEIAKKDFDEISRDTVFIAKAFRDSFRIPDQTVFNSVFLLCKSAILKQFKEWKKFNEDDSSEYFGSLDGDRQLNLKKKRFDTIRTELKIVEDMRTIEFELDGLQAKLFEVNDKITKVKAKEEESKLVFNELNEFKALEAMPEFPPDIEKRLGEYEKLEERKNRELASLDNKLERFVNELAGLKVEPVGKDKMFVLSALICLISIVSMSFLKSYLIVFLIVFLVSLLSLTWRLMKFYKSQEQEEKLNKEIKSVNDDKGVIDKKFEIETSIVKKFLKKIGASGADDALDMIKRRKELVKRIDEEKESADDLKKNLRFEEILKAKEELTKSIAINEEKLRAFTPVSMDPNDLKNELLTLKNELGEDQINKISGSDIRSLRTADDPYGAILHNSSKLINVSPDKLIQALKDSYLTNLKILSKNYFESAQWGSLGLLSLLVRGEKKNKNLNELNEGEYLISFFAYKFTILQLLTKNVPAPVVVLDNIEVLNPELSNKTFLEAVNHLSKSCQVIAVI